MGGRWGGGCCRLLRLINSACFSASHFQTVFENFFFFFYIYRISCLFFFFFLLIAKAPSWLHAHLREGERVPRRAAYVANVIVKSDATRARSESNQWSNCGDRNSEGGGGQ